MAGDVAAAVAAVHHAEAVLVKQIISKKEKKKKRKTYLGLEMSPGIVRVFVDGGQLSTRCCYALTCESVMVSVMSVMVGDGVADVCLGVTRQCI